MKKSVVSIVKGTDPQEMTHEALDLLGGVESLIKPGSVVVIKPNAGHAFAEETSVNTNPGLVAAIIKEVRKAKPKEVIVAEAAASGQDTTECFEISGIGKAAEDAGVDRLIDMKRETDLIKIPIRDARADIKSVLLPRFLVEADHLIDVPIFKSHVSMVFTCALKNIKGLVQDKVHRQMHQTDLAAAMMDLWSVSKADLSIADLIRPAEGYGPHFTMPVDFGCIVAGKDPVAVDATVCRMVGLDINKVAYFKPAYERGLGNFKEGNIIVRGKQIKEVYKELWLPYLGGFDQWPEYNIDASGSCSSCQSLLAATMEKLKAMEEYDKNAGITILVGPKKKLPEGVDPKDLILFGSCLRKYKDKGVFIEGCPPMEGGPIFAILDRSTMGGPPEGEEGVEMPPPDPAQMEQMQAKMEREKRMFSEYVEKLRKEREAKAKQGK